GEALPHCVEAHWETVQPLAASACEAAAIARDSRQQAELFDKCRTVVEAELQMMYACRDSAGNPKATEAHARVDEAAAQLKDALDDMRSTASDFVQQLVLFSYSLGVFWGYYLYTKATAQETLKLHEFEDFQEENEKIIAELLTRVEQLELALRNRGIKIPVVRPSVVRNETTNSASQTKEEEAQEQAQQLPKPRFPRLSSLPVDAASNVLLKGESRKSL
ncbi:hypothetical protein COOONC_08940, partial [Cooperia oncophora]